MFLGVENAVEILKTCARHRIFYILGFMTIVTLVIFIGYVSTKDNEPTDFHVPIWLIALPALYVIYFSFSVLKSLNDTLAAEKLEYELSGMSKKEYINFKASDDRLKSSFSGSVFTTGILSGSSVLGPFIRGDRAA
jgi:amino acid transporter